MCRALKPIGTITKYYPFLEQETIDTIEDVMKVSTNYRDFVVRLVDMVCDKEVPIELFRFSVIHALTIGGGYDDEIWDLIVPKCIDDIVMKPWNAWFGSQFTVNEWREAMKTSISSNPSKWLLLHVYYIGAWISGPRSEFNRYIKKASQLLQDNPELRCFEPGFHLLNVWYYTREGNFEALHDAANTIINIAKDYDDTRSIVSGLSSLAKVYWNTNPQKALAIFEEAVSLAEELGDVNCLEDITGQMGWIYMILGEYDLALKFFIWGFDKSARTIRATSGRGGAVAWKMSTIYCEMDMPDQALEWITWYDGGGEGDPHRYVYLQKALTLTLLHRFIEGQDFLNKAHELIMKRGFDSDLAQHQFVNGVLELYMGNPHAALHIISNALQEFERLNDQASINRCLLTLTKIEMKIAIKSREKNSETSGSWMDKLGTHARDRNYSGIRMQHALLKAEYQKLQGDHEAARLTLEDALTYSDSIGVKTLRKRILDRIKELDLVA